MQTLNLINLDNSDIKYTISRFPDREVQIALGEFSHKDRITIQCRVTSAEELFILMQVCDILSRHEVVFVIQIYYLMGMRMDRVMDFNRPFSLKVVIDILNNSGAVGIDFFNIHSGRVYSLLNKPFGGIINIPEWENLIGNSQKEYQIVLPDSGAFNRYYNHFSYTKIIEGTKVRDVATGKILFISIKNPEDLNGRPLLIIDDLCDGGGTFVGIAEAIRKVKSDAIIDIAVAHMVNPKGIENLSKNFNHVWFTNSYKDWSGYHTEYGKAVPNLPKNVTQINIV